MTPQEMFNVYDQLFAQEGWKDLVADFTQRKIEMATHLLNSNAGEIELYRAQGRYQIYDYIINLENTMDAAKQHMAEEAANG
jgi:hypothetical protein